MPTATSTHGVAAIRKAALSRVRATAMGLVPPEETLDPSDPESVRRLLEYSQRAGIGRGLVEEVALLHETDELNALLDDLNDALEASPVPAWEWPAVERVLGTEQLASLLGISVSSLKRYSSGARATPDDVAARLHFLALVIGDLAGSYNDIGVRRWFLRSRSQLGGRSPAEMLRNGWDAEDEGPSRVRALAAALLASPAT